MAHCCSEVCSVDAANYAPALALAANVSVVRQAIGELASAGAHAHWQAQGSSVSSARLSGKVSSPSPAQPAQLSRSTRALCCACSIR